MPFDGRNFEQDEVLALLRWARERVAKPGGWAQCRYERCIVGAIFAAAEAGSYPREVARAAINDLRAALKPTRIARFFGVVDFSGVNIEVWNDCPGRTQAEVVALFDRAIARREAQTRE